MLKEALDYLKQGYSVIPLHKRSKIASVEWKIYQSRLPTVDELVAWFDNRDVNLGIITGSVSKVVVVDVDEERGGNALAMFNRFSTDMIARTGKGYHLYYKHPGWLVENQVDIQPGIDIRADGGYVVAPPSIHANGTTYSWIDAIPR